MSESNDVGDSHLSKRFSKSIMRVVISLILTMNGGNIENIREMTHKPNGLSCSVEM